MVKIMNKLSIIIFILIFKIPSLGISNDKNVTPLMNERWNRLNNIIDAEIKTIRGINNPGPDLLHRVVELKTQKIELIHEKENRIFLTQAIEKGNRSKSRSEYFKKSQSIYRKTRELGLRITNQFKNYHANDEVYYTLAMNERDYANNAQIEEFLRKSLKYSNNPETRHKSLVELGEYLYNEKRYRESIQVYQHVISNRSDQWQAKHHFNLAWCYYQINEREKGIKLLHRAHRIGNREGYISLDDQILNSIALFYIQTGREAEGVNFFTALKPEINTEMLIYMTNLAHNHGTLDQTTYILNSAIELAKKQNQTEHLIRTYSAALDIYRNSKNYKQHRITSNKILELYQKGYLSDENNKFRLEIIEKIEGLAGYFQIQVDKQSKFYPEKFNSLNSPLLSDALYYFNLLIKLAPEEQDHYLFYRGETLVTSGHYTSALATYRKSFDQSLEIKRDIETLERTMDSILATLGEIESKRLDIEKSNNWRFTRYAYRHHVRIWPQSNRTRKILPKYFMLYFELQSFDRAENILTHYHRLFPADLKIQQDLAILVMDKYVEKKMPQNLNSWIQTISSGFLNFDQVYIDRSVKVLGELLFEHFRQKEGHENSLEHIIGYKEIFFNEVYPEEVRSEAAFHIARINTQNAQGQEAYKWLTKLKKIIPATELNNFGMAINGMINEQARQGNFIDAVDIAKKFLITHCKKLPKDVREDQFEMLINFKLVSNNTNNIVKTVNDARNCQINDKIITSKIKAINHHAYFYNDHQLFQTLLSNYWSQHNLRKALTENLISFYWKQKYLKSHQANRTLQTLNHIKNNQNIGEINRKEIQRIQHFKKYQTQVESIIKKQLSSESLDQRFPKDFSDENFQINFERELEYTFNILNQIQEMSNQIISFSHPEMITLPHKLTSIAYKNFSDYMKNYEIKNLPDYLEDDFNHQITDISHFLSSESQQIVKIGRSIINDQEIISANGIQYMSSISETSQNIFFDSTIYSHSYDRNLNSIFRHSLAER